MLHMEVSSDARHTIKDAPSIHKLKSSPVHTTCKALDTA